MSGHGYAFDKMEREAGEDADYAADVRAEASRDRLLDLPDAFTVAEEREIEARAQELAGEAFDDGAQHAAEFIEQLGVADNDFWIDITKAACFGDDDALRLAKDRLRDLYVSRCADHYFDRAEEEMFEGGDDEC